jgi:RimJ/RimL family protein N-acetyltransferase
MSPAYSTIPTLTDGVVTLRAPIHSDVQGSYEQCQDLVSQRWTAIPIPYTLDDANIYMYHFIPRGWETGQEWGFVVEAADDAGVQRFCGTISLRNRGEGRAEIAYGAHPWARGRGVMERALRLLIEWGFAQENLNTIEWLAQRGNWPSWRLAWRLGFSFEGVLRGWLSQRGELHDAWVGTLRHGDALLPRTPWLESPTLVGPSVTLRKLEPRDLPKIVETRADGDTQHWLQQVRESAPHTLESDKEFVVERLEDAAAGRAVHWAVTDQRTDMYVGQVSLFGLEYKREAEMAFWAHPHWRRRGWTTEAGRLVVKHAFIPMEDGGLGLRRLTADACATNEGSMRVLERAGFLRVGRTRRSTLRGDDKWMDTHIYDQLIEDRDRSMW